MELMAARNELLNCHEHSRDSSYQGIANMDRVTTFRLLLIVVLLVLFQMVESQWTPLPTKPPINPTPLCAFQLALVNHACAMLLYTPVSPPSPPSLSSAEVFPDRSDGRHHHGHSDSHGHHHGHSDSHGHHHRHGDSHRHQRQRSREEMPIEDNCCRWLKEVDDICVCDLLVHLPPFLTRPVHAYSVALNSICNVTFMCGSRWVQV